MKYEPPPELVKMSNEAKAHLEKKHTPGPWHAVEVGKVYADKHHNGRIAVVNNSGIRGVGGSKTREANTHLIAAAPDLLRVCEEIIRAGVLDKMGVLNGMLHDAVTKAKGNG